MENIEEIKKWTYRFFADAFRKEAPNRGEKPLVSPIQDDIWFKFFAKYYPNRMLTDANIDGEEAELFEKVTLDLVNEGLLSMNTNQDGHVITRWFGLPALQYEIDDMKFTDKEMPSKMFTSFSDAPPEIGIVAIEEGAADQTSPNYYTLPNGIEAHEVSGFFDGHTAQAIQYLWRHGKKAGNDPILELEKAKTFIDFRIAHIKKFGV